MPESFLPEQMVSRYKLRRSFGDLESIDPLADVVVTRLPNTETLRDTYLEILPSRKNGCDRISLIFTPDSNSKIGGQSGRKNCVWHIYSQPIGTHIYGCISTITSPSHGRFR
jgi:hypothetical protein